MKRFALLFALAVAWFGVTTFFIWALGAVWHMPILPYPTGPVLAILILTAFAVLFYQLKNKNLWLTYAAGTVTLIWLLLQFKQPSHDRDWAKDQQVLSYITIRRDDVTIHNFRHNEYRSASDFDVQRSDYQFKLSELGNVWFVVQRFTPGEGLAHVFLTFQVTPEEGEPEHFALSVEIRREEGEYFSPVQGLYRHYELNYVFGDERDLIGVRTVMRPEDRIYMYPVNATPYEVQKLFRSIASRTNQLYDRPEFYHTLLNNCMNGILRHTARMTPEEISWFDPNVVLPGYSDRFAYKLGIIGDDDQSFEELKAASRIDGRAREHGIREGFSEAIRTSGS